MDARTMTHRILARGLAAGDLDDAGSSIRVRADQALINDSSGTLIALELDAMGCSEIAVDLVVVHLDHLLLRNNQRNEDDHRLLRSMASKYGMWIAAASTGVAHPVHQEHFGEPGTILVGSDSHTPAAGAIGQFGIGLGGTRIVRALMTGEVELFVPKIWGIELSGSLVPGVSAKDVALTLLQQFSVSGGAGHVIEFFGNGVTGLSVMDRHVIANMSTELGALTALFPADDAVRAFLNDLGRGDDFQALAPPTGATFDRHTRLVLDDVEPMIALPSSPDNVHTVQSVLGTRISQAYIGSSSNPGFRDLAVAGRIVDGQRVAPGVSFDINPATRRVLQRLIRSGALRELVAAGARLHEPGCNGCIGMGQAPGSEGLSLRTVPRNFVGRSGTPDDQVALVSPETAAASSLTGRLEDPRELTPRLAEFEVSEPLPLDWKAFTAPLDPSKRDSELWMGPNHRPIPPFPALPDAFELPVLLTMGDDVSTDEILPGGTDVLPAWSDLEYMSRFTFRDVSSDYVARAKAVGDHCVVAGGNYGQGSSREHAALAPRMLGLRAVVAASVARIHRENLIAFGVAPIRVPEVDLDRLKGATALVISGLRNAVENPGAPVSVRADRGVVIEGRIDAGPTELRTLAAGGMISECVQDNWVAQ